MDYLSKIGGTALSTANSWLSSAQDVVAANSPIKMPGASPSSPAPATSSAPSTARQEQKKEEEKEPEETFGKLTFELDYNFEKGELKITVIQAVELPAMDIGGTSDPYVKMYILPDKKKKFCTKVHKKTLNPVFNETFMFTKVPYSEISSKTLVFAVFDHDQLGADDQMGEIFVPLGAVDLGEVLTLTKDIKEPPKNVLGDVCMSLRYVPPKSQLTAMIIECKNLKKMDLGGASDPYVKIYLMMNGKRVKKVKTQVKMKTLNPYYNESFKFEVKPYDIEKSHLHVIVMDYDRVGSNEPIGQIKLGRGFGGAPERHFMDMVNNPRRSIAQWHTLLPADEEEEKGEKKK